MQAAKSLNNYLTGYFDFSYFLKFIILLVFFYYSNLFMIGIVTEGGLYSPFLDHYFNYISWMRISILHTAKLIAHTLGLPSFIKNTHSLQVPGGASVFMAFQCIGLGVMSFWIAFIGAHKETWHVKLLWCLAGLAAIWFINCWRVALLLLAFEKKWKAVMAMNHHTTFNIAAYSLILLLIYFYSKKKTDQ